MATPETPDAPPFRAVVAANIRAELSRQGHRIGDLARHLDMHPTNVSELLSPKHDKRPRGLTLDQLAAVAEFLGVTVGFLVDNAASGSRAATAGTAVV